MLFANDGKKHDYNYQTNRVFRTVLDCATSYGVKLVNVWGISSRISWKSGRIDNYLDENSNASKYSRKIITTYSKKKKLKKQNELNQMMDNPDKTNTQSGIHKWKISHAKKLRKSIKKVY